MYDFKTEQEKFWFSEFGDEYINRNNSSELLASNLALFSKVFNCSTHINSCIEFGANIGMNLRALRLLFPNIKLRAIEINPDAAKELNDVIGENNVITGSILDYTPDNLYDLVLTKGVLVHINPEMLPLVYEKLYHSSKKYILLSEYYNPVPVSIPYRGYRDRLYKRDFCGELMDLYSDLQLIDYGFVYKRDVHFSQDDITWFLLKRNK